MFTRPMRSLTSIRALTRVALTARPTASLVLRATQANFGRSLATTSLLRSAAATARAPVVEEEAFEEDEQLPPVKEAAPERKTFKSIESALHAPIYRAVTERPFKYETMSEVQAAVLDLLPRLSCSPTAIPLAATEQDIPEELQQAQDLLVRAKTGTGKTLAFLIPALEGRLRSLESFLQTYKRENPEASNSEAKKALAAYAKSSVGALILSPTRELATQIANEAIALTTHLPQFGVRLLVGGSSKSMQLREWSRSPSNDIVVATPGRCVDLLQSEPMVRKPIQNARMLILDEADTLLDMGFSDDIATVSSFMPDNDNRQTFLFSATVSKSIREVARRSMKQDHVFVDTVRADDVDTHLHIPQFHTVLPSAEDQIVHILRLLAHDQLLHARKAAEKGGVDGGKAVIFLPTTRMTQMFSLILSSMKTHLPYGRDTNIVEIHSKKSQEQRTRASDKFRSAKTGYSILVTSDVSARGVDYPGVTRVIQVGVPGSRDLYIHRVGRTGRAGKEGRGDLVLLPWEIGFISWQLNDVPLKPCTIGEAQRQLTALAEEWDANPATLNRAAPAPIFDRRSRDRPARPCTITGPVAERLETLPTSLTTNVLPTLDELDVRETFASLLGYYIMKAHELRTTKEVVLTGLREWSVGAMGLEEPPFVSQQFLAKMGMKDGRTKHRGKARDGYSGLGRERGGDRQWEERGSRPSRPSNDRYGARKESYGDRPARSSYGGDRDGGAPRRNNRPSFGRDGSSSPYGSKDADSWEKPPRRSSGGGDGGWSRY
ncbi:P-loop containing nucleoside triphosphate hydrolase protein [Leucosporidium creatinivorum]|uniref:ATP-dependent RNA helicase n=1 Tax=Leucosporidium creatinivorum TaxID=106004 RepID=A0A1Y2D4H0_9BASI|nr:P-loop containing nucleoside triphosphate hydrolase protein [Leucosporidium creatinivorum]